MTPMRVPRRAGRRRRKWAAALASAAVRDDQLQRAGDPRLVGEGRAPRRRVGGQRRRPDVVARERAVRHLGEQLGSAQRGEEPLAGERVVEARRVARQHHAAHARLPHPVRERPHHPQRPLRAHPGHPRPAGDAAA